MKQIDDYVESLFKNYGKSKDINELKEETRTHLLESVNELLVEGRTAEESIASAIERFGDNYNLNGGLESVLCVRRTFAKPLLYIALICLAIGILTGSTIKILENYYDHTTAAMTTGVYKVFNNNDFVLSPTKVQNIAALAQQHHVTIQSVTLYHAYEPFNLNSNPKPKPQAAHVYSATVRPNTHLLLGYGYTAQQQNEKHWYIAVQLRVFQVTPFLVIIPITCVICYWILFTIWASINAHRRNRLNWGWIAAFCCLNVLAWILFRSIKSPPNPLQYA